jgi:hypothetical protein
MMLICDLLHENCILMDRCTKKGFSVGIIIVSPNEAIFEVLK